MSQLQPLPDVKVIDDLVVVRIEGSLSLVDSQHIYHQCELLLKERGYFLALMDLGQAAVPSPESRKWITNWFRQRDLSRMAVATHGTSLLVRTVNRMFDGAVSVLSGRPTPARHFSNEAEARAWLAVRRQALRESPPGEA